MVIDKSYKKILELLDEINDNYGKLTGKSIIGLTEDCSGDTLNNEIQIWCEIQEKLHTMHVPDIIKSIEEELGTQYNQLPKNILDD